MAKKKEVTESTYVSLRLKLNKRKWLLQAQKTVLSNVKLT